MDHYSSYSYLRLLAQSMRAGLLALPAEAAERHAAAVRHFASREGGFCGRRGGADLYYTTFAIRALHALAKLDAAVVQETQAYLARITPATLIDVANLLELGLLLERPPGDLRGLLAFAERFRAADGGYGKAGGAERGSTYHSFLAVLSYNLLAQNPPEQEKLGRFVLGRQRPDGGFCEDAAAARGGTNTTAAGLALLFLLGVQAPQALESAAVFLREMQDTSGGWRAMQQAPLPDLLSTYTGALSLAGLGALSGESKARALAFAASCEKPGGGFSAGPYDNCADAEYTYYGLGMLAMA